MTRINTHLELFLRHDNELMSAVFVVRSLGAAVGDFQRGGQRLGVTVHYRHMDHRGSVLQLELFT